MGDKEASVLIPSPNTATDTFVLCLGYFLVLFAFALLVLWVFCMCQWERSDRQLATVKQVSNLHYLQLTT